MSQDDIMEWLRLQRSHGDCSYFSVKEIRDGMSKLRIDTPAHTRVYEQCLQLYRFGILEVRRKGLLIVAWRLKRKYTG